MSIIPKKILETGAALQAIVITCLGNIHLTKLDVDGAVKVATKLTCTE
jgi:hypothetical protein